MNVYDFDGTIYDGDSSVDFFCLVLRRRPWLIVLVPLQLWGIISCLLRLTSKETMKERFFVFIRFIPLEAMIGKFWERNCGKIRPWYRRQRQDTDVIISASPEFLLAPIVKDILKVRLIASPINVSNGKFTGRNCYGEEKLARIRSLYPDERIQSFYGDSSSDTPLARTAENAFRVRKNTITDWSFI